MSVSLPNGAIVEIAADYDDSIVLASLSNAAAAIGATQGAHTLAAGDYVEVTSGWSRLTNKIVRLSAAATPNLTMEGVDTQLQSIYPAGQGAGRLRRIDGWTQLSQVLSSGSSGGEQQFREYQFLESDAQMRIPTFKNAAGLSLSVADDPTLPGYILASKANDDRLPRAVRVTLPNGSKLLYNAYVTLNKTPSMTVNEIMACEVTLSLLAEVVRYAT